MPGAEWLELLCRHIPDRYEHLVRYVGWYSNRARGGRAKMQKVQQTANTSTAVLEPVSEFAARAKAAWARLIRKVYEADPLECPRCKGPMRVIALIDDPGAMQGLSTEPLYFDVSLQPGETFGWQPLPRPEQQRAFAIRMKPGQDFVNDMFTTERAYFMTYHPVPDIA